ncbi:hypothetical protein BDQ17DRAFT_1542713 [Cyathus striatus]|nr:hypothetical protein BDQ17DRAFT_1542713 [Cyathus striatus]
MSNAIRSSARPRGMVCPGSVRVPKLWATSISLLTLPTFTTASLQSSYTVLSSPLLSSLLPLCTNCSSAWKTRTHSAMGVIWLSKAPRGRRRSTFNWVLWRGRRNEGRARAVIDVVG